MRHDVQLPSINSVECVGSRDSKKIDYMLQMFLSDFEVGISNSAHLQL